MPNDPQQNPRVKGHSIFIQKAEGDNPRRVRVKVDEGPDKGRLVWVENDNVPPWLNKPAMAISFILVPMGRLDEDTRTRPRYATDVLPQSE